MSTYYRNGRSLFASHQKSGLLSFLQQTAEVITSVYQRSLNWSWLKSPSPEFVAERKKVARQFGWYAMLRCWCTNKIEWAKYYTYLTRRRPVARLGFFARREKISILGFLASAIALILMVYPPQSSAGMTSEALPAATTSAEPISVGPANWLSGTPHSRGSRSAVMGAYQYAAGAGYTFITDEAMRDEAIAAGELVKLEGPYIRLVDVDHPYAMPVVRDFVNRLGQQYAEQGCGKLVVTSSLRTLEQQAEIENGSDHSVHPTGMSVDLRREDDGEVGSDTCLAWLGETLLSIEGNRRIDVTFENSPRHFHVVVVPHVYEAWLNSREEELDPEVEWLATALYFEAAFNESMEGYRAIGWSIRNRALSEEFPNTILEVVAEGAAGRSNGGCQFSFMCDGKRESIETLCAQPNSLMSHFWRNRCEERWGVVVNIAEQILTEPESRDPTGGAVLYYAASMDEAPYWASSDMKRGTTRRLGSHIFACSVHRGDDACRS